MFKIAVWHFTAPKIQKWAFQCMITANCYLNPVLMFEYNIGDVYVCTCICCVCVLFWPIFDTSWISADKQAYIYCIALWSCR